MGNTSLGKRKCLLSSAVHHTGWTFGVVVGRKVDFKRHRCCFSCINIYFWLVILQTCWGLSPPVEEGLSMSISKLLLWHFRSHSAKNMDVAEVSCWAIGHMNVLVPPNSSVGSVAVWAQPGMGGCWRCDET